MFYDEVGITYDLVTQDKLIYKYTVMLSNTEPYIFACLAK